MGAAEAILIGPAEDAAATQATSGNDAMAASKPIPGRLYGAMTTGRPAGGGGADPSASAPLSGCCGVSPVMLSDQ